MRSISAGRKNSAGATRPIVIHSLADARAAFEAAARLRVSLVVESAEAAAGNVGPMWFLEVLRGAKAEHPKVKVTAVMDCGDSPGYALAALRAGCRAIRVKASPRVKSKIRAVAKAHGAVLCARRPRALDLLEERDPLAACLRWLGVGKAAVAKK